MSKKFLWFVTACPACSKRNQLEIQVLGRETKCQFCDKQFNAIGSDSSSAALDDPLDYWIEFTAHGIVMGDIGKRGMNEFGDNTNRTGRMPR